MTSEGLSPAARALLDAARDGMAPDAAAIQRMKAKVVSTAGATATTAIAIKLGIVAMIATLAAGAAIYDNRSRAVTPPRIELTATHNESSAPIAQRRADSMTGGVVSVAPDAPIEMAPDPVMRAKAATPIATDTRTTEPRTTEPRTTEPRTTEPRTTEPRTTEGRTTEGRTTEGRTTETLTTLAPKARADLAREVELLDLAMTALRRGDTTSALRAIRTHATETRGAGQLAEDAAAIEVEVLCRRHDPSVVAKLDAFDARFPRSAQRSRLSATCP